MAKSDAPEPSRDGAATPRRVDVALVASRGGGTTLVYAVPEHLYDAVVPGAAVAVPLAGRRVTGVVVGESTAAAPKGIKPIAEVLPGASLPPELLELTAWAARYYQTSHTQLLRAILPPHVRLRTRRLVRPAAPSNGSDAGDVASGEQGVLLPALEGDESGSRTPLAERILARLPERGLDLGQLRRDFGGGTDAAIRRLAGRGSVVVEDVEIARRAESRALLALEADEGALARSPRQAALHLFILERAPHAVAREEIEQRFPGSGEVVRRLLARGLLREAPDGGSDAPPDPDAPSLELGAEQAEAVRTLEGALGSFATFLLFGVTASGKTEVYLRAAAAARAAGRSVLLLVPEIGLTPQLVDLARRRFPGETAVLHSGLTEIERARAWHDVAGGRAPVVIGVRSAVFAPVPRLGLIVVDEEHDAAYKQEESPRYHGRDVAVMRGKLADVPVVLASATPSLESYHAARTGRYRLLELPARVRAVPFPTVERIDLRDPKIRFRDAPAVSGAIDAATEEGRKRGAPAPALSPPLEEAIVANYRAGEQTLLFLNRRGFARFLQCEDCGHVEECPHCSVSLTVHRAKNLAACHHCGYARTASPWCTECSGRAIGRTHGTEKIEAAVHTLLPSARIARLDRDTGASPGFVEATLASWRAGDLDVLVGTQMIAKGHDAPGVTLIGVILADASLHFPDFRAAERTFQLLTQVAGRAGRGDKAGRVLVQTRHPDHPTLVAAMRHDFRAFADVELRSRAELDYPPFGRLARIVLEGEAAATEREAERIAARLRAAAGEIEGVQVLGPAPAPIERLRGRHRVQLLVKAAQSRRLAQILGTLRGAGAETRASGTRLVVDVDPISML